VLERLSYDAWGKRRHADGSDDPSGSIASQTSRGFTGHEELDSVGLVHMNGRVYDPLLARFGTADPITESPFSTQGWNRYAYVGNSPLNFTDPSGYCFMGCFWQSIFKGLQKVFRAVPILGTMLQIAAGAICGPPCAILASAFVAGVTSGSLGAALKAGFITAVTFGVMQLGSELLGFGGAAASGGMETIESVGIAENTGLGGEITSGGQSAAYQQYASLWNPHQMVDAPPPLPELQPHVPMPQVTTWSAVVTAPSMLPTPSLLQSMIGSLPSAYLHLAGCDARFCPMVKPLEMGSGGGQIGLGGGNVPGSGVSSRPGRLGGEAHRGTVQRRGDELEGAGHTITGGGGRLPERSVVTPEGNRRFPDISTRDPTGKPYHENVGRSQQSGEPIARERRSLEDIEKATKTKPGYTPYDR